MNGGGYGGLLLLLLGIGFIFLATTAKGKQMLAILFGAKMQTVKQPNPTDPAAAPKDKQQESDLWQHYYDSTSSSNVG